MFGAIVQAIDHAMERTQKGFRGGIDVANSQHGGAASVKNSDVTASKPSETKDITEEEDKASTEQSSAGSATGAMKGGAESGAGNILGGAGDDNKGGLSAIGGGEISSIISDERLKARELANSVKQKWHGKVLSDENAKNSRNVSSAKRYLANASNSVAEAGRIATGQSSGGNKTISNDYDNSAFKTASDIQSEVNRNYASKKAEESITK